MHPDKKKKKERKAGRTTPPCRLLATRRATSPKPPNIPGRRGCGASTRSNNCRKKTTDQSLGLLVIWRPASSHEVRQPWQEGRGQRGGRRQECQQARAGPDQPGCGVARLQNQNWWGDRGEDGVDNGRADTNKRRRGNWRKKEAEAATRPSPSERKASTCNWIVHEIGGNMKCTRSQGLIRGTTLIWVLTVLLVKTNLLCELSKKVIDKQPAWKPWHILILVYMYIYHLNFTTLNHPELLFKKYCLSVK